jgi:3-hydroxyisobutyrate dehydrogenase
METELQAARMFLYTAAAKLDRKAHDASKWSAMAKRFVTDTGFNVANDALQVLGGYGYLHDYGIEKLVRDLRVHQILEGTNNAGDHACRKGVSALVAPSRRNHHDHHRLHRPRQYGQPDGCKPRQGRPHRVHGFDLVPENLALARDNGVASVMERGARSKEPRSSSPCCRPASMCCRSTRIIARQGQRHAVHRFLDDRCRIGAQGACHCRQNGLLSIDAPVSGGTGGAAAGTLTFMAGGSTEPFAKAEPVLKPMAGKIVHCGDAGAGQAAKICNNMILGISMIGVGEAFVLAEKLGLSHQALFDVASTSSGQCWSLTPTVPSPARCRTLAGQSRLQARLRRGADAEGPEARQEAAQAAGAVTPLGAEATQLYALFNAQGEWRRRLLRHHPLPARRGSVAARKSCSEEDARQKKRKFRFA